MLLSHSPINQSNYKSIGSKDLKLGKPIYFYFVSGSRLGVTRVHIRISEKKEKEYKQVGSHDLGGLNPNWRYVGTHFQKEYFERSGNYKVEVLSPSEEILATSNFVLK